MLVAQMSSAGKSGATGATVSIGKDMSNTESQAEVVKSARLRLEHCVASSLRSALP